MAEEYIPKWEESKPLEEKVPLWEDSKPIAPEKEPGVISRILNWSGETPEFLSKFKIKPPTAEEVANRPMGLRGPGLELANTIAGNVETPRTNQPNVLNKVQAGVESGISGLLNSFTTKGGLALAPLGVMGKLGSTLGRLAGIGFGGHGLYKGGEEAIQGIKESDPQKIAEGATTGLIGGTIAGGSLGGFRKSKASKGTTDSAPSDIVEETLSNPGRKIEYPYDVSQYGEVNEPLPTPWKAVNEQGKYLVPDTRVKATINYLDSPLGKTSVGKDVFSNLTPEEKVTLKSAPVDVQRQFLHDKGIEGIQSDTPQINRFENYGVGPLDVKRPGFPDKPWIDVESEKLPETQLELKPKQITEKSTAKEEIIEPKEGDTTLYSNPIGPLLDDAKKAFKFFMPSIDKVHERLGTEGKVVAPAMTKFYADMAKNRGKWFNLPEKLINENLPPLSRFTGNDPILDHVRDYLWDRMDYGTSTISLNPVEQRVLGIVKNTLQDIGTERNLRPALHQGPLNPDYIPQRMKPEIAEELSGAKELDPARKQEYLDFQTQVKQVSPQEALARWNLVSKAFKEERPGESNRGASFGPLDKAEGYGIPRDWREPGLMNIMEGYVNRAARRLAYHDNFERDPAVIGSLEKLKNRPEVMPIMQNIEGRMTPSSLKWDAFQGATKAGVMQTWSGIRDLVSTSVAGLQYQLPSQYIPSYISGLMNISEGLKIGLEQGVIQRNKGFLESNQNSLLETENLLRSAQTFMNRASGRSLMDQMSRAHQIGVAKYAIMGDFSRELAGKGNKQTQFVLSTMLPDYKEYLRLGVLPKESLDMAAAEWVGRTAGKYDSRTIPAEMMSPDNPIGFLMNMNKFNIDRMNNLHSDVLKPMIEDGNYYPLLGLLLAGLVGGSTVVSLNEMISGRKSKAPSLKELQNVPESTARDYLYWISALADAQGTGGQAGSLFKMMMDIQHGNTPNPQFGNPLMDVVLENTKLLGNAFTAIGEEGAKPEIVLKALNDFFINFIQDLRLAENNLDLNRKNVVSRTISRKPLVEESSRKRDYRTFQQLSGLEEPQKEGLVSAPQSNPYLNITRKELDRTIEPSEYGSKLLDEVRSTVSSGKSPIEVARDINSLRTSGDTDYMPSMTSLGGLTMARYLDFIEKTQGVEAKNNLIKRWGLQRALGETKMNSIPPVRLR